jgi:hypothetical protein
MYRARPRTPFSNKRSAEQRFLLGSAVRLHNKGTTGIVIGSSQDNDRVRVRWDDTGKVTHVKKTSLTRVR